MAGVVYQNPSFSDYCLTIGLGDRSKYPEKTDGYLSSFCDRMASAVGRCLNITESAGLLDKALKLTSAGMELTQYVSKEAYAPAAPMHKGLKEVRGWLGGFKIFGGVWVVVSTARNLWDLTTKSASKDAPIALNARGWVEGDASKVKYHQKITDMALHRLAIVQQSFALAAGTLYTLAFTSKTFAFIDKKYQVMKGGLLKFSQLFPKFFFGLHIVSVPKDLISMKLERETYNRETAKTFEIDKGMALGKQLEACQKRRQLEIGHYRNQMSHSCNLVKTGFEFVGDADNFAGGRWPLAKIVSSVGVAVFDFMGVWLKTM